MKTKLRLMLAEIKMTRQDLAEKAGVPYSFVRGLYDETMRRFDIEDLKKLCEFLDCEMSDLIYFEKVA
jgi:DNA-binding Xre family transcriptional regulator